MRPGSNRRDPTNRLRHRKNPTNPAERFETAEKEIERMGRAGRPSKSGKRTRRGKRVSAPPLDRGAEHVQRLRARFARFQDG